ncbi:Cof-type HAD-IIB family hydrolase [Streptococcus didelphis]|uniref:Cof-type HAD-IIB family hydrolase n=1 Tax=Streptococcus didelphis TaxID=102886 RepID=A0ABY9LII0_9STRE|nr:Cof-type HAD-IIB family hydrolase [Streptococcus didelphis]WMB28628.1 Cof-type HAD-IIB family hydrolase [Streptococcus didelphis]WMB29308.1 Cof-type HAD-IIB family hydrolase [Streptococcus didelphis]
MITLIAIDLDGTLLNHQKEIPADNIQAIQEATAEKIKIVLCTGRPSSGTKPYFDQLGLQEDEFLILNNGCSTYSSLEWKLIHSHSLNLQDISDLYDLCKDYPGVYLTLTAEDNYYVLGDAVPELVQADGDLVFTQVKAITIADLASSQEVVFQAMYMGVESILDGFEEAYALELSEKYSLVRSQDYILEVMPQNVTKAYALQELAKDLNCSPEEIMAIGDAPNDIEMLSFAGLGVAMGNASPAIKKLADKVTADCDHAGVAKAIREFALKG